MDLWTMSSLFMTTRWDLCSTSLIIGSEQLCKTCDSIGRYSAMRYTLVLNDILDSLRIWFKKDDEILVVGDVWRSMIPLKKFEQDFYIPRCEYLFSSRTLFVYRQEDLEDLVSFILRISKMLRLYVQDTHHRLRNPAWSFAFVGEGCRKRDDHGWPADPRWLQPYSA